ncbi:MULTISPECIES: response regulator [unclassified Janthinobacterium]|uniref:hybrid sensor histidine kinase/response regulator n=1 Tax=unclassified Janthinobacterium TaxID=2610881 RepID=UPI00162233D2|nr:MULTISPECIES: response regulator [unclassified Janthinobacterium]MBB5607735.1 signal transduction histidine kinase/ActR/RegA family two-component response regulator [Janthinobacterium sp. S3T4]MBB5613116.1 signal transduction histidine kinase/ActR/RegA family two-component response regulator [Janthinobacterium sp. S3M3]
MEERILIYAPAGQDAILAGKVLASGAMLSHACHSAGELAEQLALGAGGVLTVDEALHGGGYQVLDNYARQQPDWSDLPIILLTHAGRDSLPLRQAIATLGNLTLLERPVQVLTLITSAHAMLRARQRQYQVRETQRRKDQFLASLGHELRNPLAPIKTSAALLGHLYPDSAQVARLQAVIERQVTHLTRLVDDLLDVARINTGKIELQYQDFTLEQMLGHVLELCQPAASEQHIGISQDLPPYTVRLHADYARVVQIFANIVSNAVKFTPPDGHIHVAAHMQGSQLLVSIEDNGIGLDADAMARIFSMFEQSRTVEGKMTSGLGIGLSLARQFAEMHGGTVDADSAGPGHGSRFLVTLPASKADIPDATPAMPETAPAPTGPAVHVLVVDDNHDAADSLLALFQMEGYAASAAYDGEQALAAVASDWPQLILMDLGMPGIDGYEAAQRIRQQAHGREVLMIALTGWGQGDARQRTAQAGFDHHVTKPVDFDAIAALFRQHLNDKKK